MTDAKHGDGYDRAPPPVAVLRVSLRRARGLPISDWGLEGGQSDPFVVFRLGRELVQSSCRHQQLDPEWCPHETFEFPVFEPTCEVLEIRVLDHDTFSAPDLLGTLVLPVAKFAALPPNAPHLEIYRLEVPGIFQEQQRQQQREATLELEITLVVQDANDGLTLRMWENEVWSLTGGWVPSDTEVYRRYSTYDDMHTGNAFANVAPAVPNGLEGQGWGYVGHRQRGGDGWLYGYNFLGPLTTSKGLSSCVRRRLWENQCVPPK